jgi:N-acetylated-alpha-linked acidic dipeptidase
MNAQDRGAVGVAIYSDPAQDGFGQGKVYPDGPWRPRSGVQRGSIQVLAAATTTTNTSATAMVPVS